MFNPIAKFELRKEIATIGEQDSLFPMPLQLSLDANSEYRLVGPMGAYYCTLKGADSNFAQALLRRLNAYQAPQGI